MIRIRKEDYSLLKAQFDENERQTNRIVAFVSLVFVAICISMEILLKFDYSLAVQLMNRYMFMPVSVLILIAFFVARSNNYAGAWVKYMLLSVIMLLSMGSFFAYTTYMSYMVFLPVFISASYFNKKFMIQISVTTLVLFIVSCLLNILLEPSSEMIQILHSNSAYNSWTSPIDAIVYIITPMLLTFIFISAHSINETVNGRRLLEAKAESVVRNAAVEAELNMASEIQRSVLPDESFTTPDRHFRIAARELPAREVGGDFYDYFMINDHTLCALIADVSDKGAPAAMFMMSAKKAIQCAVQCCHDLDGAIKLANSLICQDNKSDMFLTLWLGIIDTRSGVGKYINAGHPRPLIRHSDGSVTTIDNDPDIFLGSFPDMPPKVNIFRMNAADILLLSTDGVTDAMNGDGSRFGNEKLIASLAQSAPASQAVIERLVSDALEFSGVREQFDDITLLALQCSELDTAEELVFDVNSDASGTKTVIDGVEALLEKLGCPDEKRRNVGVICDEVCVNICDYAYDGEVGSMRVEASVLSNHLSLSFIDCGGEFNPLEHNDPEFSDVPMLGGLGIYFIRNLADEMTYCRLDGKNILSVTVIWDI